jgi:hypothetical protein
MRIYEDIEDETRARWALLANAPHPKPCNCFHCQHYRVEADELLRQMDERIARLALHDKLEGREPHD